MSSNLRLTRVAATLVLTGLLAGGATSAQQELVMEPLKDSGLNVYPAFEGWYKNPDGSFTLLVGYYNRNKKQILDIPIGPQNRIEPGGPDQGQPTHFLVGRGWGTVAIKVPKDFGDKKLTWTLTANGKTVSIPLGVVKGYQIEPFKDAAMGNEPAILKFEPTEKGIQGPPPPLAQALSAAAVAGEATPLSVWINDDMHAETPTAAGGGGGGGAGFAGAQRPRLSVVFSKYRGTGTVTFDDNTPTIGKDGKATTNATFSAPGEYFIRIEGNDASGVGGGGFQCCWTTAYIRVTVKAATTGGL
ncbi:MAG: hypothetical protein ACRD2N_25650 [Vicinamibacterales bacterium]